ncbi:2-C-methyl-D-erythritol 2,4-cyclodiphosphate synthase [bacterium]|nr:2-C-methyl-D-erythritol 2,4-cyclodiphosphate synthase [bacterium]
MNLRIGSGFDVHRFEEGRELWLGGILIENHTGLAGHSDADVLIHAVIDALSGAAAIGDIGELFPDTDNAFKNIRSTILLEKVVSEITSRGWLIVNVDSTVVCETPKISRYKLKMREKLAEIMQIPLDSLMIKGKTTEKLGFAGRKEGIAAFATALLEKKS